MIARIALHEQQTAEALKRLAMLRERGAAPGADDPRLVAETLEELSIALHELQASSDELREQNEALLSAEGTIAAERQRYQELYNFAPDGYLVTDVHGMVREANPVAAQILGVDRAFLLNRPLVVFLPKDMRQAFRSFVNEVAAAESGTHTLETLAERKDKTPFAAVFRAMAARRAPSGEREIRWTLRDVSEQKQARQALRSEVDLRERVEEALRRSESRYRHLVEYASDIVYELDETGRFTFCNVQAAHRLLGYAEYELIGRRLTEIVKPDHRKSVQAFISKLRRQKPTLSYLEFPVRAKDGREIWLGQHAAVRSSDKSTSIQAVARDITDQIQRLGELERSGERWRELSAHLQTKIEGDRARVAREIHDELGAALTVIRMELSLPSDGAEASDEAVQRLERVVRRVDNAIESVRRICSDLRPSLLDNMGLCAAIEWLAQDIQERAGIRCEVNLQGLSAEPAPDRATALFRIVQEALTNAIRHAKASSLTIRQRTNGEEIVFEIQDDGCGIKPEDQGGGHRAYGIVGMLERAQAFGGSVRVRGGRTGGTHVIVRMPSSGGGGG